jgi:rRNA maturation RNase YbeY
MKSTINEGFIDFIFHKSIHRFPFPEDNVRKWIFLCIKNEKESCGFLNYIFCDDIYLHSINVQYLNHDTYTDIITFDYYDEFNSISGDMFISIDRVRENSLVNKVTFQEELFRVMIHGVLHLIGFDDKNANDFDKMRSMENFYLNKINFTISD